MKKIIIGIIAIVIIGIAITIGCLAGKKDDEKTVKLEKIKLAEVTHSPFYAPLYVAIENGYFKEQGLDVELILTPGADKVATSVISGDTQIGFAGPESAIYVYEGKEEDYLVTFAGLTKRDGQFIVSRNKDFKLEDLYGKEIKDYLGFTIGSKKCTPGAERVAKSDIEGRPKKVDLKLSDGRTVSAKVSYED